MKNSTVPTNDLAALRFYIARKMHLSRYRPREIQMFLAGATILGHLRPHGCSWWREHQTRQQIETLTPDSTTLDRAGDTSPNDRSNPVRDRMK